MARMKITRVAKFKNPTLGDLKQGETFRYQQQYNDENIYMVLGPIEKGARDVRHVSLHNGEEYSGAPDKEIVKVLCTLNYKDEVL